MFSNYIYPTVHPNRCAQPSPHTHTHTLFMYTHGLINTFQYQLKQAGPDGGISVIPWTKTKEPDEKKTLIKMCLLRPCPAVLPVSVTLCLLCRLVLCFPSGRPAVVATPRRECSASGPRHTDSKCSSHWKNKARLDDAVRIWPLFGRVSQRL